MLGQPRPGGKTEVWRVKGRFAGTSLCGPKILELSIISARLELVMEQVIQSRDWKKCDDWETGQEGERQKATAQIPSWQAGQRGDWHVPATEAKPSSRHHKEEILWHPIHEIPWQVMLSPTFCSLFLLFFLFPSTLFLFFLQH